MMRQTRHRASLYRYPRRRLLILIVLIVFGSLLCCVTVGFLFDASTLQGSAEIASILPQTTENARTLFEVSKPSPLSEASLEPIDICFVSSIFAPTTKTADRPNDVTSFTMKKPTSFHFFLYTNLEDLESPGWTKVLRKFNYRRFITQSRWGKFMAWKDPEMKACQTIFHFDGHFKPTGLTHLAKLAKSIKRSEFGLAQKLHKKSKGRSAIAEFDAVLKLKKDIKQNVNASIEWLQSQPDFYNNCTLYENAYFGYDPSNLHFQEAAEYFWSRYSMEEDSWRDQPLWCHTIERSHIKPIIIEGKPFSPHRERQGHKNHQYGAAQDNDAAAKPEAVPTARNSFEEASGDVPASMVSEQTV